MSPEQARGAKDIDGRSDLWPLAVVTYRCLVGEPPFQGAQVIDLLMDICGGPIPVPSEHAPGIARELDAWWSPRARRGCVRHGRPRRSPCVGHAGLPLRPTHALRNVRQATQARIRDRRACAAEGADIAANATHASLEGVKEVSRTWTRTGHKTIDGKLLAAMARLGATNTGRGATARATNAGRCAVPRTRRSTDRLTTRRPKPCRRAESAAAQAHTNRSSHGAPSGWCCFSLGRR